MGSVSSDGFSDDLQELATKAWKIYRSLANAPEDLRDLQNGVLSVVGALRLVYGHLQEHQISSLDLGSLQDHLVRCRSVICGVESSLNDLKQARGPPNEVAEWAQKVLIQGARISSFYEILKRNTQKSIIESLESLSNEQPENFRSLITKEWSFVVTELSKLGISQSLIEEEYFFIDNWLQNHKSNDRVNGSVTISHVNDEPLKARSSVTNSPSEAPSRLNLEPSSQTGAPSSSAPRIPLLTAEPLVEEELPGYSPSTKPTTLAEKTQGLEQTTAILNAEAMIEGQSSSSAPPAYTFEEGSDEAIDQELSRYIRAATADELKRRYQDKKAHPERGPHPYSWLPKRYQQQFVERPDVESLLEPNSFSVMSYQTAPHYVMEIELLMPVLRISSDGSGDDHIFREGAQTLKTMISALSRFVVIQDQRPGGEHFSDLDALDYEYDTAKANDARIQLGVDHRVQFPVKPFELAQKSYYNLLTYVMGMLHMLRDIFPGRTYVTRPREELIQLWKERRVSARTAWIQKQLAGWSQIEEAVQSLRDWHRLRSFREQAITAINTWKQSVHLMFSGESADKIHLTILRATDLPKTRNVQIKIVCYCSTRRGKNWTQRAFQAETAIQKSWCADFNEHFDLPCPERPRWLDLQVNDVGLIGKELGRVRLTFTDIPGVEFSLHEKSLMYGYDEIVSLPISLSEAAKGKDRDTVTPKIEIRLRWMGRYSLLEDFALPMTPPGKMFKKAAGDVPLPFEDGGEIPVGGLGSQIMGGLAGSTRIIPSRSFDSSGVPGLDDGWEGQARGRMSQQSSHTK